MATAARRHAEEELQEHENVKYGIWTDSTSKPGTVAIGLAIRGVGSCLIAVDGTEYDGAKLFALVNAAFGR